MSLTHTDFYKVDHRSQYPKGTELVFSNWTPRRSRIEGINSVIFFGLQYYLMEKLDRQWKKLFFNKPRDWVVGEYGERIQKAGLNITYEHIKALHDLRYLPLEIWALPEGSNVPIGVPMFVMWNTKPEFFWLTNYIETDLSANLWGPCTSATLAREYRKVLLRAAEISGGSEEFVNIQGHDFSYRGMYGTQAASISGAAHLLYFNGTDTIPAIDFVEEYYYAKPEEIGGSVPATEHSVMCMGTKESEIDTFRRLITEIYPKGVVSIVSDTWNYWKVLTEILPALKKEIMARDGKVVIRPDSGDPVEILTGYGSIVGDKVIGDKPEEKGSFQILWEIFGGKVNQKGFKELDPHIGLIYGDSITLDRCNRICGRLLAQRFVPNMVLGIGSYTYQYVTRDTFGFALKSTAGIVNGEVREIFKDPVTDDGEKKSAKGFIAVYNRPEGLIKKDQVALDDVKSCAFTRVFMDGNIYVNNFRTIRSKVRNDIKG